MVRHMVSHKVATHFKCYTYFTVTRVNRIEQMLRSYQYFLVTTVGGSVYLIKIKVINKIRYMKGFWSLNKRYDISIRITI